jgi:hypothetical protein
VFPKIFVPATLRHSVTSFHHGWPVGYAGHLERLPVGVCKETSEDDVGNIARPSVAPIVTDLVFGSHGFRELGNKNGNRVLAVGKDLFHYLSRTILDAAFGPATGVVELRKGVFGSFALRVSGLCQSKSSQKGTECLKKYLSIRHDKMLYRWGRGQK